MSYRRIQFTQDLLPADITGHYFYNQKTTEFEIRKGPLFASIVLADEINRAPPKTQSALLEAMQERKVTIEGTTFELPYPVHGRRDPEPHRDGGRLPAARGTGGQVHDQEQDGLPRL